jgi:hypothetical protein
MMVLEWLFWCIGLGFVVLDYRLNSACNCIRIHTSQLKQFACLCAGVAEDVRIVMHRIRCVHCEERFW